MDTQDTIKDCLYYGYYKIVINWLKDELNIINKEDALEVIKPLIISLIKEFNISTIYNRKKGLENKLNKSIHNICRYFDSNRVEKIHNNLYKIK